ncbi:hypothetical protein ACS0TY_012280 [Phlomoides rotata]
MGASHQVNVNRWYKFGALASIRMVALSKLPDWLQRQDERAFTYINAQETKPALVVNLTEDEVSTRRAWGVWVCLTEMDKVKYSFKIYQNSING